MDEPSKRNHLDKDPDREVEDILVIEVCDVDAALVSFELFAEVLFVARVQRTHVVADDSIPVFFRCLRDSSQKLDFGEVLDV